jgi:hypothetical protein
MKRRLIRGKGEVRNRSAVPTPNLQCTLIPSDEADDEMEWKAKKKRGRRIMLLEERRSKLTVEMAVQVVEDQAGAAPTKRRYFVP